MKEHAVIVREATTTVASSNVAKDSCSGKCIAARRTQMIEAAGVFRREAVVEAQTMNFRDETTLLEAGSDQCSASVAAPPREGASSRVMSGMSGT